MLSYLTKQSWSITGFLTFPGYDHSKCSGNNSKLKLWKTSPVLVYKILYSNSLTGRRALIKLLSNWTPKINIKDTHCTALPHPKRGLKNSFHNIQTGIRKEKYLHLINCLKKTQSLHYAANGILNKEAQKEIHLTSVALTQIQQRSCKTANF